MLDPERSLYHRLGGYDTIAAIVDDLLPRLVSDPQLGGFWKGRSRDSMKKDRQLLVDFLGAALGGPVIYLARDMKTAHEGLGISESDWAVFMHHTEATLDDLAVPAREKSDFLASAASLKSDIVEGSHVPNARQ